MMLLDSVFSRGTSLSSQPVLVVGINAQNSLAAFSQPCWDADFSYSVIESHIPLRSFVHIRLASLRSRSRAGR